VHTGLVPDRSASVLSGHHQIDPNLRSCRPTPEIQVRRCSPTFHTATPVINPGKWWYSAALGEFRTPFLNGLQRSVNRKVQGSNPCPGAKSEYESPTGCDRLVVACSNRVATRVATASSQVGLNRRSSNGRWLPRSGGRILKVGRMFDGRKIGCSIELDNNGNPDFSDVEVDSVLGFGGGISVLRSP
jgi:hypothetical protein